MNCAQCSAEVERSESFEIEGGRMLCASCFVERAQKKRTMTGEDRRRLKAAVKEEMASVLPREALREIVEEGYSRLVKGEGEFDEEVGRLANEIERMAGLAMCREMLNVIRSIGDVFGEQEEEIRRKMRRLGDLAPRP